MDTDHNRQCPSCEHQIDIQYGLIKHDRREIYLCMSLKELKMKYSELRYDEDGSIGTSTNRWYISDTIIYQNKNTAGLLNFFFINDSLVKVRSDFYGETSIVDMYFTNSKYSSNSNELSNGYKYQDSLVYTYGTSSMSSSHITWAYKQISDSCHSLVNIYVFGIPSPP